MTTRPPAATVRTRLTVPLRFADGYVTTARVLTFDGLADGGEHLALGYPADGRDYTAAAQMLLALGEDRVRLLSNNPDKAAQLERLGVAVTDRVATHVHLSPVNGRYLATKADRGAHLLDVRL